MDTVVTPSSDHSPLLVFQYLHTYELPPPVVSGKVKVTGFDSEVTFRSSPEGQTTENILKVFLAC